MNFVAYNDFVIVQKIESSKTTASGIILTSSTGADSCKVISAAPNTNLTKDDVVMIRWTDALKIDGTIFAVDKKNIVCKIEE